MGLGAPKKRAKISQDPNNTAWSRSSSKYGQRILESQGWTPGRCLGASNARHPKLYSAASASHIKIAPKDDSLGLGARRGVSDEDGKATGLDVFHNLLGRLNGKREEELEKEQNVRSNLQRSLFIEQRWGRPRFVSGGFLVGDRPQDLLNEESSNDTPADRNMTEPEEVIRNESKPYLDRSPKKAKKWEFEKERGVRHETNDSCLVAVQSPSKTNSPLLGGSCTVSDACRARRGVEKAERKLGRHFRREVKTKSRSDDSQPSMALPLEDPTHLHRQLSTIRVPAEHAVPHTSRLSTTPITAANGRNAVRQRYIRHKKMAMMDSKALNEILMIKP